MGRRFLKLAWIPLAAWLGLCGLERLAQGQSGTTTGTGSTSGSSGLSGGSSLTGGSGVSGGSGQGVSGGSGQNNQAYSGGQAGFSGNTTSNATSRGSGGQGGAQIPAKSNPFAGNYVNPFSLGLMSNGTTGKGTFNQPLYGAVTSAKTGGAGGGGSTATSSAVGFTTFGMNREAPYTTELGDDLPLLTVQTTALQAELTDVLQRSTALKNKNAVALKVEGANKVVLSGQVTSERERRLVESLVRLTPGVRDVSNQLTVAPIGKQ